MRKSPLQKLAGGTGYVRSICLVIAAAAEYEYNSQDDDPSAMVIEQVTQAVSVHNALPPFIAAGCRY
jgi:hypothetical protein